MIKTPIASDLINDVLAGRISLFQAEKIMQNRDANDATVCNDAYHTAMVEQESNKVVGSYRLKPTKGYGHRTINAKGHGKAAKPVAGAGYGKHTIARLHRPENALTF